MGDYGESHERGDLLYRKEAAKAGGFFGKCVVGWRISSLNSDRRRLNTYGVEKPNKRQKGGQKGMDDMTIHIETLGNLIEALKAEGLSNDAIVRIIEQMTKKSD